MSSNTGERTQRWGGLDGLRAFAVVAVLLFHFLPTVLPGGFLGVDVFFALSGYLITRIIVTEQLRFGYLRFAHFYRRRARRLLPAVALLLLCVLAAAALWRDQLSTVRPATAAAVGYVSNWWFALAHQSYFVSVGRPSMLQHLWSLGIEEQFYVLWPLVLVGVLRAAARVGGGARDGDRYGRAWVTTYLPALFAALLATASAIEMIILAVTWQVPYSADASRLYYGTDTHSTGLLLGSAFGAIAAARAVTPREAAARAPRSLRVTDAIAGAALVALSVLAATLHESDASLYRGGFAAIAVLSAVLVAAVARRGSAVGHWLDRPVTRSERGARTAASRGVTARAAAMAPKAEPSNRPVLCVSVP